MPRLTPRNDVAGIKNNTRIVGEEAVVVGRDGKGEVVDKIIYINNPNSPTQIVANDYFNDTAYAGMADHNPVRATFTYTHTVTE